jgi:hypothetical protein
MLCVDSLPLIYRYLTLGQEAAQQARYPHRTFSSINLSGFHHRLQLTLKSLNISFRGLITLDLRVDS